jgi:hypothetical protein
MFIYIDSWGMCDVPVRPQNPSNERKRTLRHSGASRISPKEHAKAKLLKSRGFLLGVRFLTKKLSLFVAQGFCVPLVGAGAKACASFLGMGRVPTSGRAGTGA